MRRTDGAAGVEVRELADADRGWLCDLVDREWGLPVVSVSGVYDLSDLSSLPGFVAVEDDRRIGAATYRPTDGTCEVVTLNALTPSKGVGSALLAAVKRVADSRGLRLWLITTDENLPAIEFYRRRGMEMVDLHRDFVDTVRCHKVVVDDNAAEGVPYRHALEFSY
jgi:GNAT superfamily N-acetyltransferase